MSRSFVPSVGGSVRDSRLSRERGGGRAKRFGRGGCRGRKSVQSGPKAARGHGRSLCSSADSSFISPRGRTRRATVIQQGQISPTTDAQHPHAADDARLLRLRPARRARGADHGPEPGARVRAQFHGVAAHDAFAQHLDVKESDDTELQLCCRGSTATCPTTTLTRTSWRSSRPSSGKDEPITGILLAALSLGQCRQRLAVPEPTRRGRANSRRHRHWMRRAHSAHPAEAARRRAQGVREAPPDARDDHRAGEHGSQLLPTAKGAAL